MFARRHASPTLASCLLVALSAFVIAPLATSPADASPVVYEFSGVVTGVPSVLQPEFQIGEPWAVVVRFESTTPDNDASPAHGRYEAVTHLTAIVGDYMAVSDSGTVNVFDNTFGFDQFSLDVRATDGMQGAAVNGEPFDILGLGIIDDSETMFASDALPTAPLDLSLMSSEYMDLCFGEPGEDICVRGQVVTQTTSVTAGADAPRRGTTLAANRPNPFNPSTAIPFELGRGVRRQAARVRRAGSAGVRAAGRLAGSRYPRGNLGRHHARRRGTCGVLTGW